MGGRGPTLCKWRWLRTTRWCGPLSRPGAAGCSSTPVMARMPLSLRRGRRSRQRLTRSVRSNCRCAWASQRERRNARLALQTAAEVLDQYRDGAWLVELAPILDAAELTEGVAAVFSVPPQAGGWRDALTESLRGRQMLLMLDNCEHVLDEAASLVEALIAACPGVTIMATSREALGVAGESAWPVPSLGLGADSTAATLFIERARDVVPAFDPGDDLEVVAEICRRLDGIPLAIELAAARVRSMSPNQIRDRLDERFRLLTGSRRSMERHQTLRHAVQWSYDLLNDIERRVLQRSSVFAGGFAIA